MKKNVLLRATWIMALSVTLSACGGGGGSQPGPSGTVIQGPVEGATVFCDQIISGGRGNYQIDAIEEPTVTITRADGSFTIPAEPTYPNYLIVSHGGTDTITGQPAMQMLAPAGATNISPLTTMVVLDSGAKDAIEALGVKYDDNIAEKATPAALLLLKSIETAVSALTAILNPLGNTLPPNQVNEIQEIILEQIANTVKSQSASQLTSTAALETALSTALQNALTAIDTEYANISVGTNAATLAASIASSVVPAVADAISPSHTFSTNPGHAVAEGAIFKGDVVSTINDKVVETVANNDDLVTSGTTNTAPVASNGSLTVEAGVTATGTLAGSDAEGNRLTYTIVANGAKGTATIINRNKGTFTFTANAGASGSDAFTFKVSDGIADSNIATVTVTIIPASPANTAPVASGGDLTVQAGDTATGTLAGSDADGDPLTFAIVANGTKGTATVNPATGAFTYTADAGASGSDTFTFKVNDGNVDSNIATVTVTITPDNPDNNAPVASNGNLTVLAGTMATGTLAASDADGQPLTFTLVTNGGKGTAAITNVATGAFTYTANSGASGTDTFTFKASDGTDDSSIATVTVTITPAGTGSTGGTGGTGGTGTGINF